MQLNSSDGVSGLNALTSQQQASQTTGSAKSLGKDSFLNLLITQMRYQDPLSPMDNTAFLAQLAQFSSLEQMQNLNDKFQSSVQLTQSLNNSSAAGLIGREVRASGDTLQVGSSGSSELGYFLANETTEVTVMVYNSQGNLVRSYQSAEGGAGSHRLEWDGRDLNGQRVPPGAYTFKVSAKDADGAAVQATTVVQGTVEGVTYQNGTAYLIVDGREVPFADLLEVSAPK